VLPEFLRAVKSFALARVVMAAIELDLFRHLEGTSLRREDLLQRLGAEESPIADAFLQILVSFGFLSVEDGRLALTPLGRSVLPAYQSVHSWNREMQLFYTSLDELPQLLRSGKAHQSALAKYWAYKSAEKRSALTASEVTDYSSVMDASQEQLSQIILDTYDFSAHDRVIDFGGGYGRLAMALAGKHGGLRVTVADLPAVCDRTRSLVDAAGFGERIDCLGADFLSDELPGQSADAILFVRVLHDWDDDDVTRLLAKTRACLKPGGIAIIIEPMTDEREAVDPGSVSSSLMIALLGGRRRSVQEYTGMLESAGYREPSSLDCGLSIYRMVTARLEESLA